MSLQDRFRIDELTKYGSKSITRDETGNITVRRVNNKEVNPDVKKEKPFGEEPIKGSQVTPRTKEDLSNPQINKNSGQTSFSGESSAYIETPIYNEDELKKAIDVKVDELVKEKKQPRGKFVPESRYLNLQAKLIESNNKLRDEKKISSSEASRASRAESLVSTLQSEIDSLNFQLNELNDVITENTSTIGNQQGDIQQKTTDIFTLQADVARWQAEASSIKQQLESQTENLKAQLGAQEKIIESLNNQNKTLQDQIQSQREQLISQQQVFQAQLKTASDQAASTSAIFQTQISQLQRTQKKKIICNELYHQGFIPQLIWDADERYGDMMFEKDPRLVIGYQMWARQVVKIMRETPQYSPIVNFFVKPWTEWMAHQMGVLPKTNWRGYLTNLVGKQICYLVYDLYGGEELYKRYIKSLE